MTRAKSLLLLLGSAFLIGACKSPRYSVTLDDVEASSALIIAGHDDYVDREDGEGSWAALTDEQKVAYLTQSAVFADLFETSEADAWVLVTDFERVADPVFDRYVTWVSEEFPYDPMTDVAEPLDRRVLLRDVALIREYLKRASAE